MRKTTFFLSIAVAGVLFSGCIAGSGPYADLNSTEISISKNSTLVEHENMKSAIAILISKTEQSKRDVDETKAKQNALIDAINKVNTQLKVNEDKLEDISLKLSMTNGEVKKINSTLELLKPKQTEVSPIVVAPAMKENNSSTIIPFKNAEVIEKGTVIQKKHTISHSLKHVKHVKHVVKKKKIKIVCSQPLDNPTLKP